MTSSSKGKECHVRIAVVASPNAFKFAVIDFTNPAAVPVTPIDPGFGGFCVVDADADLVAVGNTGGDHVLLYTVSNPAKPVLLGTIRTGLSGIGCISIDGKRVLVGELNGNRATLIDFTTPAAPKLVSTLNAGISSLGSVALSGARAVAAGPNDQTLSIINYSSPAAPAFTSFDPLIGAALVADLDGTFAVAGDQNGPSITLIDVSGPTILGTADSTLAGITGISIDGSLVAAGSTNDTEAALVSFATPGSPLIKTFNPAIGGGASVFIAGSELVAGGVFSTTVKLFKLAGLTPTLDATANSGMLSIGSIALTEFTSVVPPPPPAKPNVVVTPVSLDFGPVAVCLSNTKTINIRNVGNANLAVSTITATGPFTVTPGGPLTVLPNSNLTVTVKFTPTFVGPVNGTVTIRSNDDDTPIHTVPLVGTGTPTPPPKIEVSPLALNFGACLAKYFFGLRVTIVNANPCVPLIVESLSTGHPAFPVTADEAPTTVPTTLSIAGATIPPGGKRRFVVVFAPRSLGVYESTLIIRSNDPARPSVTMPLNGSCVLAKATAASLALDRGDYMLFGGGLDANMATMRAAVNLFLELMPEEQGDYLGTVTNHYQHPAIRLTNIAPSDATNKQLVRLNLANLVNLGGGGNVGGMLIRAATQLTDDLKRLFPVAAPERRVVITFTGGRERHAPFIADAATDLLGQDIELYAVACGTGTAMNAAALSQLAATSGGRFFAGDDLLLLRKNFVQVLADAFRMNMAADPIATIARGGTRDVPMRVTRCERRLRFVCAWDDLDEQLGLELIAPDGTLFTPTSQATNALVRFGRQPGAAFYDLMLPPLDDDDVIGPQPTGTWVLRVTAHNLGRETERFTTALLVESDVLLRTNLRPAIVGKVSDLRIDVLHNGAAIAGAEVEVTVSAPQRSAREVQIREVRNAARAARRRSRRGGGYDFRATTSAAEIPRTDVLDDESRMILEAPPLPAGHAESLAFEPIRIPYRTRVLYAKPTHDFDYVVPLPRFVRDGIHKISINVRVPGCGGIVTRYVEYAVAPKQNFDIDRSRFQLVRRTRPGEPVMIRFTPRDGAGNLLGIGLRDAMHIAPPEGSFVVRTVDHFDGSYSVHLAPFQAAQGEVRVEIDGEVALLRISRTLKARCLKTST